MSCVVRMGDILQVHCKISSLIHDNKFFGELGSYLASGGCVFTVCVGSSGKRL